MNVTILQAFHWYFPAASNLWNHLRDEAPHLQELGITHVWLPPAYKSAKGIEDPGYGVYDLYDLGEFDQKGSVRTKFGTKAEYLACIDSLHKHGMQVLADVVMNHRFGADATETVSLVKVNSAGRKQHTSTELRREVATRFTFPERKGKYSDFVWDWQCFSGVCLDNEVHLLLNEYNRGQWEQTLSHENGNYAYLTGNDVEFRNPAVREELQHWGQWYVETAKLDGFRIDALKHMSCDFPLEWLDHLNQHFSRGFFVIGEYWEGEVAELLQYLDLCHSRIPLFDVPLHFRFFDAAQGNDDDLRNVFDETLVQQRPGLAVTFVDNHDTQALQKLESQVQEWFKPIAYAFILLREHGIPCAFYADLYGAGYRGKDEQGNTVDVELPRLESVETMLKVRKSHAYGYQQEYFDDPHLVGWTRHGDAAQHTMGCAVLISNREGGTKRMNMGTHNRGKLMVDVIGGFADAVRLDDKGEGVFHVKEGSVSVWIERGQIL